MAIETIVDTGPLVGWFNETDQWHDWSVAALRRCRGPFYTTEIVLGEACWHLGQNTRPVHALLQLVRRRALILQRVWPEHLANSQEIMLKYPQMDAADASLVTLAEMFPNADLVSTDRRDFAHCRGLRNRALNLILPS